MTTINNRWLLELALTKKILSSRKDKKSFIKDPKAYLKEHFNVQAPSDVKLEIKWESRSLLCSVIPSRKHCSWLGSLKTNDETKKQIQESFPRKFEELAFIEKVLDKNDPTTEPTNSKEYIVQEMEKLGIDCSKLSENFDAKFLKERPKKAYFVIPLWGTAKVD